MPNYPHHTVAIDDATCPECWRLHRVPGMVRAVIAEDGTELYRRCGCGAIAPADEPRQVDLFALDGSACEA